uniref:HAT C-terminal dimerisation domain-containing protein n=1 Tax=Globodera rostochiensis TaxID=31243 RepID=A0A914H858_GLORO
MLERIFEQREAIFTYAMNETRDFRLILTNEQYEQIDLIIKILKPIQEISVRLFEFGFIDQIRSALVAGIQKRVLHLLSTVLELKFVGGKERNVMIEKIKLWIESEIVKKNGEEVQLDGSETDFVTPRSPPAKKAALENDSIFSTFDQITQNPTESTERTIEKEFAAYFAEGCAKHNDDVFALLRTYTVNYPLLSSVALKYFCIPATSCASESLFSSARHTCSYDRVIVYFLNAYEIPFYNWISEVYSDASKGLAEPPNFDAYSLRSCAPPKLNLSDDHAAHLLKLVVFVFIQ